jgi:hypothetical protein
VFELVLSGLYFRSQSTKIGGFSPLVACTPPWLGSFFVNMTISDQQHFGVMTENGMLSCDAVVLDHKVTFPCSLLSMC